MTVAIEPSDVEFEPAESSAKDLALTRVDQDVDPEHFLAVMESKAKMALRVRAAMEAVVFGQTYAGDWTIQGDKACLSSAGAERIARQFQIQYEEVKWTKEEFQTDAGPAYRYVYEGYASMGGKRLYVIGSYSTRDKFLGYANSEWRPIEDINESHIRSAAYHVFMGNALKALIGMRGIPVAEFNRIMKGLGQDVPKQEVQRGRGTQGGAADPKEGQHKKELAEICMAIANAGQTVIGDKESGFQFQPISESDDRTPVDIAGEICGCLSRFQGNDGPVEQRSVKKLKGKWLLATLAKAREMRQKLDAAHPEPSETVTPADTAGSGPVYDDFPE
jgi:hypothetical protein